MVVCRTSPNWDLSDAFLMIGFGFMGFGEEDHRDKVPFSSHHSKDVYYQHDLMLTLITRLRQCRSSPV